MPIELKPHQLKAVEELRSGKILKAGVGTGKTYMSLGYYAEKVTNKMTKTIDVYVFTTAKKRDDLDWIGSALEFGLAPDRENSQNGAKITVDSWNNITNYEDVTDAFIIFDEQRLVGNGAWVKAFYKLAKSNHWIILSATPGDSWIDYIPVFIANGYYKNRTEFLKRHVVFNTYGGYPKVDHYVEEGILQGIRRSLIVDIAYARHTKRRHHNILVPYDEALFNRVLKDRWHVYEDRPLQNVAEMFLVMRKVVNSDISRYAEIMRLMEKHPRLIVFYNFDYELELLRTLNVLNVDMAEWNGHKHQPVPTSERWVYLVQYTSGAEAWNCTDTDAIAFFSLNYSYKIFEQAQGRIDRLDTPFVELHYYILRSNSPIDLAIVRALAQKKSFNERDFSAPKWDLAA